MINIKNPIFSYVLTIALLMSSSIRMSRAEDEWLMYDDVKKVRGMDLPMSNVRDSDHAFYSAIQYGSKASDVMYILFDCKEKMAPHDSIKVFIDGHSKYGKPITLRGRKKKDSYSFPAIALRSSFGDTKVDETFNLRVRSLWDVSKLDVDVDVLCRLSNSKQRIKSSFRLKGNIDAGMNSAAYLEPTQLIQDPELSGRWDHRSDPPHVRGKVRMGNLSLVPESGISDKVSLVVFEDDVTRPSMSKRFKVDPSGAYSEFTFYPWKRLKERREYSMKLSMDLRPFFTALSVSDKMVLR